MSEQVQKPPSAIKDLSSDHLGHLSSVRVGGLLILLVGAVQLWFPYLHEQAKTAFTVATTLLLTGQARAALEGVASSLSTSWVEGKKVGVADKESQARNDDQPTKAASQPPTPPPPTPVEEKKGA